MVWRRHRRIITPLIIIIVYSTIALIGGTIYYYLFPGEYGGFFPTIGIFYLITGLLVNFLLDYISTKYSEKSQMLLNVYMIARTAKFFLTLIFLMVCINHYADHKTAFAVTLLVFYFAYMFLELYMYYLYEKRRKINAVK